MLAVYVLYNVLQAIAGRLMADISQRALKQLRADLFTRVQRLPVSFFGEGSTGELMSRLTNDVDAINQAISQNVTTLVASLLSMLGIIVAMFVLDRWLALASLFVVPIMFWFTQFVARYTRKGFRDLQRDLGQLNGVMEEAISGQKTAQAFRRKQSAIEAFQRHNQQVFKAGVYANSYALLLMPITSVLGNLFVIVLAGLGGWLALAGLVSVGIIATFINYAQHFVNPLRQLANLYNSIQAALAGAERIFAIFDVPAETDEATRPLDRAARRRQLRARSLRLCTGHGRAPRFVVRGQAGPGRGLGRPDRRGQDHHHQPADALLRARKRRDPHRRSGHPQHPQAGAAQESGARAAGHVPVLGFGAGEHSLRSPRGQ